jgi:hypothetical protein
VACPLLCGVNYNNQSALPRLRTLR